MLLHFNCAQTTWDPRVCIPNKLPGDTQAGDVQPTVEAHLQEMQPAHSPCIARLAVLQEQALESCLSLGSQKA